MNIRWSRALSKSFQQIKSYGELLTNGEFKEISYADLKDVLKVV